MKGGNGYDESIKNGDSSLGFYELFGMKSSYLETQIAAKLVKGLATNITMQHHEGEVSALTIAHVSKEREEELEMLLNQMKVYPWVEETEDGTVTFAVDNKREINRLAFFSIVGQESRKPVSEEVAEEAQEVVELPNQYAFPLPIVPVEENPKVINPPRQRVDRAVYVGEVPEADMWMKDARDNFDQGLPFEYEEQTEKPYRKGVDLSLFKNRYRFYKDAIEAPDGEKLSWEDHRKILLEAKYDPEKMKQAVDMSVGLVKMVVDRILKKFGTNEIYDEDDLFQSGMEGLLYGLSKLEERSGIKPASYLVPCIEGSVRIVVRTQKRVMAQPTSVANLISKYRQTQTLLERKDPNFLSLSRTEQEEKISLEAGFSLLEKRLASRMVNLKREEFDEESINPDSMYKEKSLIEFGSRDQELVNQSLNEVLETLSVREEMVARLHFGLVGGSRLENITDVKDIFSKTESHHVKPQVLERFQRLYEFTLENDDFDSLSRGEQMFVALLGKVPESFVTHLYNDDPFKPTDLTLDDIGAIFGVTSERVRGILSKAMRKLKHPSRSASLHDTGYLTKESSKVSWSDRPYERTVIDEREIN